MRSFLFFLVTSFCFMTLLSQNNEDSIEFIAEQAEFENLFHQGIEHLRIQEYEKAKGDFKECLSKEVEKTMKDNVCYYLGLIEYTLNNPLKSNEYLMPIISNDEFNPIYSYAFDFVMQNYNQLKQPEETEKVKMHLYKLYNDNKLPDRQGGYFCFDKFSYKGMLVYAEESFSTLDTPATENSFSKNILYVYNENNTLDYTIETVKIHKLDKENPRYVLNKRFLKDDQLIKSFSFWQFTYDNPIDLKQLYADAKAIMDNAAESQSFFILQDDNDGGNKTNE